METSKEIERALREMGYSSETTETIIKWYLQGGL
jgi:hypothetical protein